MPQQLISATRNSWRKQTLPLPEERAKLKFDRLFYLAEYQKITHGLIPAGMDDKWFIFLENDTLFFYRSWTGFCIYQLHFITQNNNYYVDEVWVNRNSEQYKEIDDHYDIQLLNFLIDNLLLGQNTPFPVSSTVPENLPKGLFQHSVAGTGYPEVKHKSKETWVEKIKRMLGTRN